MPGTRVKKCKADFKLFTEDQSKPKWRWICLNCGVMQVTDKGAPAPTECHTDKNYGNLDSEYMKKKEELHADTL